VSQFHDTMVDSMGKEPKDINHSLMLLIDSLGKEPKDINHSLMLLTKESVRHILASCNS
jgi:hypothetical protein